MEKRQNEKDKKVNRALILLSILSFFSALIDGFDFVDAFGGLFFPETIIMPIQMVIVILIFAVLIYVFYVLSHNKED